MCQRSAGSIQFTFELVTLCSRSLVSSPTVFFSISLHHHHRWVEEKEGGLEFHSEHILHLSSPFRAHVHLEMLLKWTKKPSNNNIDKRRARSICACAYIRSVRFVAPRRRAFFTMIRDDEEKKKCQCSSTLNDSESSLMLWHICLVLICAERERRRVCHIDRQITSRVSARLCRWRERERVTTSKRSVRQKTNGSKINQNSSPMHLRASDLGRDPILMNSSSFIERKINNDEARHRRIQWWRSTSEHQAKKKENTYLHIYLHE